MARQFLGVTAGLVLAFVAIAVVQSLGYAVVSLPADLDPTDAEALASLPAGVYAVVLFAYATGAFTGAWLAARIAGGPFFAFLVGGVLTLVAASKAAGVPQPAWFTAATILVFLPSAWVASRLAD